MLGDGERAGELFSLLNPINHSSTRAGLHKYKVEPYVAVGDVYAVPPHTGRGGWTWYTGSAGWMYRAALESILGSSCRANGASIPACRVGGATLRSLTGAAAQSIGLKLKIRSRVSRGVATVELDGVEQESKEIALADDGNRMTCGS